jgi:hypothetical protein
MFDDRSFKEIILDQLKDTAALAAIIGLVWAVAAWAVYNAPAHLPV